MRTRTRPHRRLAALLLCTSTLIGGCAMTDNPDESETLNGDEAIALIDSMRGKGSFEDARRRLNDTAQTIAERIAAAVPGQIWKFEDDPHGRETLEAGLPCDRLTGNVARRPMADSVVFGRKFDTEEFATAADIVGSEAAAFGATGESSLFNDQDKRDYDIQGNGYEFNLGQIDRATLEITGDCFLMQSVIDLAPGQLPPQPPIVPTEPTSTP